MRLGTAELTKGLLWGELGDRGTMQAAHGHQERRAGELGQFGSRYFHIGHPPLGTRKLRFPEENSTAKRTGVGSENSTASLEQPMESGAYPVHRAAGQGQAGI